LPVLWIQGSIQRAITPERLSDNADGRHAPASQLGLTRIFPPPVFPVYALGRRSLSRNHIENNNMCPSVGGRHCVDLKFIWIVAHWTHPAVGNLFALR